MYFKLDKAQPQLEEWIKASYKKGKWSANATINTEGEIVDARMKSGLRPTPVTRDLTWGVPIPPLGTEDDKEMDGKVLCAYPLCAYYVQDAEHIF
jgi:methionyl-tRNA synthetase